ncbi:MAG: selenocysteine-specific translation elongation factor [Thermodesulfobacteriota bacterium]
MPVIFGTAGHIDHGKTSLVKSLTGMETDTLKEEKARGLSIDLGFAFIDLLGERAAVVDVPGHDRFIKNMLAGVTGIDCAIFCVASDDGIMPQTIEHFEIVRLLGVKKAIFVITKKDLASDERRAKVRRDIETLIEDSSLKGSGIIEASVVTGDGLNEVKKEMCRVSSIIKRTGNKVTPFFKGGLGGIKGVTRFPVDRSFIVKGFGTVVTGTVCGGSLENFEEVSLYPSKLKARIRGIESHHDKVERAGKGERAAINLGGVSHGAVKRGDMILGADCPPESIVFDCRVEALASMPYVLTGRRRLKLYHFTDEAEAFLIPHARRGIGAGETAFARVRLKKPLVVLKGDRFVLRDSSIGKTIAGGEVLLPYHPGMHPLKPELIELDSLQGCIGVLMDASNGCVSQKETAMALNMSADEFEAVLSDVLSSGVFLKAGEYMLKRSFFDDLTGLTINEISEYHKERPEEKGMRSDEVFSKLGRLVPDIKDFILDSLLKGNTICRDGPVVFMPAHRPCLSSVDKPIEDALLQIFKSDFVAVGKGEIEKLRFDKDSMERVLKSLVQRKAIVKLGEGVYLSHSAVIEARQRLEGYIRDRGHIKASEFRDVLGCGRKFAIELLEYFDKERITLRQGDIRRLR